MRQLDDELMNSIEMDEDARMYRIMLYTLWADATKDKEVVINNFDEPYRIGLSGIQFLDRVIPFEHAESVEYLENAVGALLFHGLKNDFMYEE